MISKLLPHLIQGFLFILFWPDLGINLNVSHTDANFLLAFMKIFFFPATGEYAIFLSYKHLQYLRILQLSGMQNYLFQ